MTHEEACVRIITASKTLDSVASQLSTGEPLNEASMEAIANDCADEAMRLREAVESLRYIWGE